MAEVIDRDSTSSSGSPMNRPDQGEGDESERLPLAPSGQGWLLEEPRERRVVAYCWSRWDQWEDELGRHFAQWKANRWRRSGMTGVVLQRGGEGEWRVYAPPGSVRVAPAFNQAARLCRQLKASVWSDPPVPDPVPGQAANDDAENAAQFAGRWLRTLDTQQPTDLHERFKLAFDIASSYDTGFLVFDADPRAGGHRFRTIEASVAATTVADATHRTVVDPFTGQELQEAQPGPFRERYVARDGETLTDDPEQADVEWLPAIVAVPLTPYQVRPTTKDAWDIESASGVLVARYQRLGDLRERYPKIRELTFTELRRVVDYEPDNPVRYLPSRVRQVRKLTAEDLRARYGRFADEGTLDLAAATDPVSQAGLLRAEAADAGFGDDAAGADDERDPLDIPDDIHVFTLTLFQARQPGSPWGAVVVVVGGEKHGRVIHRAELAGTQTVQGRVEKRALPIPVSQCKQFQEGELDFYGYGAMTLLGAGNEARTMFVSSLVEHLDRFNRRKVFYTPNSLFQPRTANGAMGTYIPVEAGSEPRFEVVPDYPKAAVDMLGLATEELRDELGMGSPVAQGKTDPSVKSALHAATIIEQVVVNLSDLKQSSERFILRSWRICLALAWARFDRRQTLEYFGEDQAYKAEDWMGSDLESTRDVRLMKNSFTMLAPSAKLQVAEYGMQLGLIEPDEMRAIFGGNYGADLGLQDKPALLKVRRQINEWNEGPPEDWQPPVPPAPVVDPMTGQPALGPDGQPQMTPGQPASYTPFERLPTDLEPALFTAATAASVGQGGAGQQAGIPPAPIGGGAMLRYRELGKALDSERYRRMVQRSPEWCQLLVEEYEAMRHAAGVQTVEEFQQAMAAQQQAEQQAEQQALQQQQAAEQQAAEQKLELEQAKGEIELRKAGQGLQVEQASQQLDLQGKVADLQVEQAKSAMELRNAAEKGKLDLSLARQQGELRLKQARAQAKQARARPSSNGSSSGNGSRR